MASTVNSDNGSVSGSAGLKTAADSSGVLALQTNGTTAVTIGTDQNAVFNSTGALTVPKGTTAQRPTPTAGMLRWNTTKTTLEVYDGTIWETVTVTPADTYSVDFYGWGGGGGGGQASGTGGGGGAANGVYEMSIGTAFPVVVGGGGAAMANGTSPGSTVPGGGGLSGSVGGSGQGGGYSGIFTTSSSQANALLIAGGGAGSGYSASGGAGGGTSGVSGSGSNFGTAGSQSAGGLGGNSQGGVTNGSALLGGSASTFGDGGGGGGGGGGYWGGGAGFNGDSPAGNSGGGGGSAYYNPTSVTSATLTAGSGTTPGDSSNALRGSYGNGGALNTAGTQGVFIIRYLGAQRGTGGTVTSSGGYTYHTFTTAGTYTA